MNPNENNPISPAGASGVSGGMAGGVASTTPAATVPSPVDFTNPGSLNTNTSSLSASDSLASAQDNLTSAGQAANTGASGVVGLDQLDMDATSGKMDRPFEALTPADPVPGSIGSVTSVPPLASAPMDMSAFGSAASTTPATSAAPVTSSAMPVMGGGTSSLGAASSSTMGAGATTSASAASAKPVQPYYNPFARTMGGNTASTASTTPTSSTNVPPALQPQTEKFSDRLNGAGNGKKKSNIIILLGWLLAVLFAVTTAIFLVLWLGAKDNEKIIYRDPVVPETPVQDTVSLVTCTQDIPNPVIDGLANVLNQRREASLRFVNEDLEKVDFANIYTFTDDAAAEASRGYFDGQNGWFGEIATNAGVTAITTNLNIEGSTARFDLTATNENLVGDYIGIFALTANEDGSVNKNIDVIRENYTNAGFACSAE